MKRKIAEEKKRHSLTGSSIPTRERFISWLMMKHIYAKRGDALNRLAKSSARLVMRKIPVDIKVTTLSPYMHGRLLNKIDAIVGSFLFGERNPSVDDAIVDSLLDDERNVSVATFLARDDDRGLGLFYPHGW